MGDPAWRDQSTRSLPDVFIRIFPFGRPVADGALKDTATPWEEPSALGLEPAFSQSHDGLSRCSGGLRFDASIYSASRAESRDKLSTPSLSRCRPPSAQYQSSNPHARTCIPGQLRAGWDRGIARRFSAELHEHAHRAGVTFLSAFAHSGKLQDSHG